MKTVFRDEHFFVIDKPEGFFVHPPEASRYPVSDEKICIYVLESMLGRRVYPVHRLDAPTSGLVVFAFGRKATRELSRLFAEREVIKTYHAVVRGFTQPSGVVDIPLEIKGFNHLNEASTAYRRLAQKEFAVPVGTRYPTARYSYLEIQPTTGRWHQIRRHMDRISHPLLGDIEHGDSHHNRFFRDTLGIRGLCLRAVELSFIHPWSQQELKLTSPANLKWELIRQTFDLI